MDDLDKILDLAEELKNSLLKAIELSPVETPEGAPTLSKFLSERTKRAKEESPIFTSTKIGEDNYPLKEKMALILAEVTDNGEAITVEELTKKIDEKFEIEVGDRFVSTNLNSRGFKSELAALKSKWADGLRIDTHDVRRKNSKNKYARTTAYRFGWIPNEDEVKIQEDEEQISQKKKSKDKGNDLPEEIQEILDILEENKAEFPSGSGLYEVARSIVLFPHENGEYIWTDVLREVIGSEKHPCHPSTVNKQIKRLTVILNEMGLTVKSDKAETGQTGRIYRIEKID